MKKRLSALILLLLILLSACTTPETENLRIATMKGPTSIGIVKLMEDEKYDFNIMTTDEIVPLIAKEELDIASVPANLAAILYQNTDHGIQVLAVNTLGVIYIVENGNTVNSISDLQGKTIYAPGKGTTPEYALRHILDSHGIDAELDFKTDSAEVVSLVAGNEGSIALLPEPYVSNALLQSDKLRIALDLTGEWDNVTTDGSMLITGVIIARKSFVDENKKQIDDFLSEYKGSIEYAQSNTEDTAKLTDKYGIINEEAAKRAIPNCNIVYIDGDEMKQKLQGYLNVLFNQNPQSVGGVLPDDDFYYKK